MYITEEELMMDDIIDFEDPQTQTTKQDPQTQPTKQLLTVGRPIKNIKSVALSDGTGIDNNMVEIGAKHEKNNENGHHDKHGNHHQQFNHPCISDYTH
jgi:hypothetical protein